VRKRRNKKKQEETMRNNEKRRTIHISSLHYPIVTQQFLLNLSLFYNYYSFVVYHGRIAYFDQKYCQYAGVTSSVCNGVVPTPPTSAITTATSAAVVTLSSSVIVSVLGSAILLF
jgi:hypothetical protein